ncbi:MAG: TetR/AcrR family transcriptional repressor of nem operon [Cognaticolwellia sp.]|jgi:TetR/AcrR family transcriptional repressor of nem operon
MGRRKTYEREEVLQRAMRLFWERGFHATTTRDLTDAMGVNIYSLYAEFGSKEGLFDAVLDHYDRTVVDGYFSQLEAATSGLETVREVVRFFAEAADQGNPLLGCLTANAMTEQAPNGNASRQRGTAYTARLTTAFKNALENAKAAGDLRLDAPVLELAHFVSVSLMGMFVMLRAGGELAVMQHTASHIIARVESYSTGKSRIPG